MVNCTAARTPGTLVRKVDDSRLAVGLPPVLEDEPCAGVWEPFAIAGLNEWRTDVRAHTVANKNLRTRAAALSPPATKPT